MKLNRRHVKKPCSPALSSVVAGLYLQKKKMYVDHELYLVMK
jgi:hypothetical protein